MALPLTSSLEWRSRSSTMEWYVTNFKLCTCNCYIHLDSDTFFTVWLNPSLFSFPYPPLPLHFTDEDGYWERVEVGQPAGHWHHCYQDHPALWDQELQVSITHLHCFDCLLYKLYSLPPLSCCRHAVMIVGQSGSGKSVTWKMLRNTLTRLNKEKKGPYQSVKVCTNNALCNFIGMWNIAVVVQTS